MSTVEKKGEWRFPVENGFVRDTTISVEARLLFIIISGYLGPDCAMPFPSLATLSRHMDRHRESVQKYLNELWCAGYLDRTHAKIKGKFASTRYTLFDRSGKKPLRKLPTTEKAATKSTQLKEVPEPSKKSEGDEIESKETSQVFEASDSEISDPMWRPDERTKSEKLKTLRTPKDYPSEREFEAFIENEFMDGIANGRPELYRQLCINKWRTFKKGKWVRIRDWKAFVLALETTIQETKGNF